MADLLGQKTLPDKVEVAIKQLKLNKQPNPGGFTASYYKKFAHILSQTLVKGLTFRSD